MASVIPVHSWSYIYIYTHLDVYIYIYMTSWHNVEAASCSKMCLRSRAQGFEFRARDSVV